MPPAKIPGPVCQVKNWFDVEDGTLVRTVSPKAGSVGMGRNAAMSLPNTAAKTKVTTIGTVIVWERPGQSGLIYESGMRIDADGSPRAYHPHGQGLDALGNAGHPGNWWGIVTDSGQPSGNPLVQTSADPSPGFYISPTSLADPKNKRQADPQRYVDSESIPYIALPKVFMKSLHVTLGDFVVVINRKNGQHSGAIFADVGPGGKLGEGSICLAVALGVPSSPRKGGASDKIVYIVFPGSGNHHPRTIVEINTEAEKLFKAWGGIAQVKALFP